MKTRRIIEINPRNDFEAIAIAQRLLMDEITKHPGVKAQITFELRNGKCITLFANPIIAPCYRA